MRKLATMAFLVGAAACSTSPTSPPSPLPDVIPELPVIDISLTKSGPDVAGHRTFKFVFSSQPVLVFGGSEDRVLRIKQTVRFGELVRVRQACSFIGLEVGDIVEAGVRLVAGGEFYGRA